VFNAWAPLYAQLVSLRTAIDDSGLFTIVMDDVDAAVIIPAGVYDMDRTAWISVRGFDVALPALVVTINDGTSITNLLTITGLFVHPEPSSTTSAITLTAGQTMNLYGTQLAPASASLHTLLFVTGSGGAVFLRLSDECIIAPTDGGQVIQIDGGAQLDVHLDGSRAQLIGSTVVGDGSTFLNVYIGGESAVFGWPQIFMTGAVQYVQQGAFWGASNGDPNGILTAALGSVYTDFLTGTQWQNTDGLTTWTAIGGADVDAVIFNNSNPALHTNIQSNRLTNQSPILNTQAQITNLGSQDHLQDPAATGATNMGATIGGGDDNTASGLYATIPGGAGCRASGDYAVSAGQFCHATNNNTTVSGGGSNTASGSNATVAGGFNNLATGSGSTIGGGTSNTSSNQNATIAGGHGNTATFVDATVTGGNTNHAVAAGATVCGGNTNTASGLHSHAEGHSNTASGEASHVEGDGCIASGDFSHAEGNGCTASNFMAHAEGNTTIVSGQSGHAEGEFTQALGRGSHAQGVGAVASRFSQDTMASGGFGFLGVGGAQTSMLVMRGATPGAAPDESTELMYDNSSPTGTTPLIIEDGKGYAFKVTLSAGGVIVGPGTRASRSIEITFNARRDAGVTTITGSGVSAGYGDVSTAAWALVPTVGVAPDRIVLTFHTGLTVTVWRASVVARVEFTEVVYA
jgi:hypothetical protein